MNGYWRELDHTADLAIEVFGSDLQALFITSAQALFASAFEPGSQAAVRHFSVQLSASDVETLLIDWLNELLYLSEKHNAYFTTYVIDNINATTLTARVDAVDIGSTRQYIKAATFHNIAIQQVKDGLRTEIVFDI
jgi:SHS2 domain-containing protein